MRIALALFALPLLAQNPNTAVFPRAVVTDNDLLVAKNNARTTLAAGISATSTTIRMLREVFPTPTAISIEDEILKCTAHTGVNYTCIRGFANTTPAAHAVLSVAHGNLIDTHVNQLSAEVKALETKLHTDLVSPTDFGADKTGATDSTAAIQAAVNALAGTGLCISLNGQYKVTGTITGTGQACFRGNYNAVPYTGNISGMPPRSASLIQQQSGVPTISLTGLSNVVDGLDFTVANGVTGVTAIYGTDTLTQPFSHNRITNNKIHGYSDGVTQGTHLAAGIDIESIGANANNNTITGNLVEIADTGYILHGASTSAVVNANVFHNWAHVCNDAAILTNAGEMAEFWLSMEGNQRAVTGVGVVASGFYLDNGEQAQPHLMLSGGSHDNTLWSSQRNRSGGQQGMTVTADSMVNSIKDLSGIWEGVSSTGQRFYCFGCVGESANWTPNLAQVQFTSDTSGTRPVLRVAKGAAPNSVSLVSWNPNGVDALGYPAGYSWVNLDLPGTPMHSIVQSNNTGEGNSPSVMDGMAVGTSANPFHYIARRKAYYMNTGASGISRMSFQLLYDNTVNNFKDILTLNGQGGFSVDGSQTRPPCNAALNDKGPTFYATGHAAGVKDTIAVCAADASDAYAWRTIY